MPKGGTSLVLWAPTTRTILVLYSRTESKIASQPSAHPPACTQWNELRLQHTTLELGRDRPTKLHFQALVAYNGGGA